MVCDGLLARLDELMDFLKYARDEKADFHGIVTFLFRPNEAPNSSDNFVCVRTVDMRNGIHISTAPLPLESRLQEDVAEVRVTLADFLYMYSGEASPAEIASMIMSGRVCVAWSSYGKLKAFADCFDFTSEKWDAYYEYLAIRGCVSVLPTCNKSCCESSTKEEIDSDWLLVADASSTTTAKAGDWEVVTDAGCYSIPREQRDKMVEVMGESQLDAWLQRLSGGHLRQTHVERVQENVRNSFHGLRDIAEKLFVSMEA